VTSAQSGPQDAPRPPVICHEMLATHGVADRAEFERGMRYAAPATLAIITACCAVFSWQVAAGAVRDEISIVRRGALVRDRLLDGEVWRLVSSLFLHGGTGHIVGNMLSLFILGIACEHAFGSVRMLGIYIASRVAGGLVSSAVEAAPIVGASGAIFGLMGCLVAMLRRHASRIQVRDGRIAVVVGIWAVWQMALGFTDPLIANFAHLGGFVAGAVLGATVAPQKYLRGLAAGAFIAVVAGPVAGVHAGTLDGPRPATNVIDSTGILTPEHVDRLEQLATGIRQASGADLMVVVIPTTHGQPHRTFATDLFNRWQLGSEERNDGLLIFVAVDDRKAEIILGDGVDEPAQVAASQRIMSDVMLPEFKRGRAADGLRRAAFACATEILGAPTEHPTTGVRNDGQQEAVVGNASKPVLQPASPRPADDSMLPYAVGGSGAIGCVGASWYLARRHLRNRPRRCAACRIDMVRLGEREDDSHLSSGQKLEERLKSVDYDVWSCPTCPQVTQFRYGAFFTRYARCPSCRNVTKSRTVNRVRRPTRRRTGLETISEHCSQCDYATERTRVLPKLADNDSSSSWSSGSSGGSSSGSGASGSW
jgi:uncharacterized protein